MNAVHPTPRIGLIWAQGRHRVIGKNGFMPWHLPEDLAYFKRTTLSHPVIMGRKTWDSLPERFRPLPGRVNIVITRQRQWHPPGAQSAAGLHEALQLCAGAAQAWVIGGAQIYAQALPLAQQVHVTEIDADFAGDAFAPAMPPPDTASHWRSQAGPWQASAQGLRYRFVVWQRN